MGAITGTTPIFVYLKREPLMSHLTDLNQLIVVKDIMA
jgi:hypothetical protein